MNKIFKSNLFDFFFKYFLFNLYILFCFMFSFSYFGIKNILFHSIRLYFFRYRWIYIQHFQRTTIKKWPKQNYIGAIGSLLLTCITLSGAIYFTNISLKIIIISLFTSLFCQTAIYYSYLKKQKLKI